MLHRSSSPHRKTRSSRTGFVQGSLTLLSIALLLLTASRAAQAQERLNNFGNFGIETPSQRFFREGQEQLEEEIHQLQTPDRASERLLTIDSTVNPQENLLPLEDPRFHPAPSGCPSSSPLNQLRGDRNEGGE